MAADYRLSDGNNFGGVAERKWRMILHILHNEVDHEGLSHCTIHSGSIAISAKQ